MTPMQLLFLPLSPIYQGAACLKNQLYDRGFLDQLHLPAPVVSIGNLSMGGTGKTPVTLHLSRGFAKSFRRPVIVSRSYRSPLRQPLPVQLGQTQAAAFFGDEAYELALRAGALVYTGPVKWRTALQAWVDVKPDLILLDDGFQHRRLARDFDIVLVDATDSETQLIPRGRLRENFSSLRRADAVILTKVNLATPMQLEQARQQVMEFLPSTSVVLEARFELAEPARLLELSFGRPVALASALARNEIFKSQVEQILGRPVDQVWARRDHHPWDSADAAQITRWLQLHPGGLVLTTEKDESKLRSHLSTQDSVIALRLQVRLEAQDEVSLFQRMSDKIQQRSHPWGTRPQLEAGPWPF